MDDLDHSIHISEYDWSSFYDESEECNLLQASLAYPDDSGLSDVEDSGNSGSVFSTDQQQAQRSPDLNSNGAESNRAEESCTSSTKLPEQLNLCGPRGPAEDAATFVKQVEICASCPGGNATRTAGMHLGNARESTDETSHSRPNTPQTDPIDVQGSGEIKDGDEQTGSDLKPDPDPFPCWQAGLNMNEPGATETDASDVRAEKERWFVTVNDSPARQRGRSASLKKKHKQKKTCDGIGTHGCALESSACNGIEITKDKHESGGERQKQSNQNKLSSKHPSDRINVQVVSDLPHISADLSENLLLLQSLRETITEPAMDRSKSEPGSSAPTSRHSCAPSQLECVQSDECEDSAEFLSIYSSDSERCFSETCFSDSKSVEEHQHPLQDHLVETQPNQMQDKQMCSRASTLSRDVAATDCEGYKNASAECSLKRSAAGQVATEVPDDDSTCKNDMYPETPGPQTHAINLSASVCSKGDNLSPLPVPDLAVIPCSVADSPETYAKSAGDTRPVYAISPFWDEMEKLTINDILQLRMSASSPPRQTLEIVTPNADDIFDTSDTGDSDYFTQPDESKPDQSSCEFSTSDFEEEFCQFVGPKRNPSNSSFLLHEDDCTRSEERETPVASEDFVGQCFDKQAFQTLQTLALMQLTESKNMYSAEALSTEDSSLLSLLGNGESSLSLSRCHPLEKNTDLIASSSLETLISASVLSYSDLDAHDQISFPGIFQYSFMEDKTNGESQCVTVYDTEDTPVAPAFGYTLCTIREHVSSSLHSSMKKPIPIFSCCHPTVRELTFPKQPVFLSANCEAVDELSPIRVMSHSFIHHHHESSAAAVGGSHSWNNLQSFRKIRFQDKGSIWYRGSRVWMFPVETEEIQTGRDKPTATVSSEGSVCPASSQVFRELEEQQRILETVWTKREGIFSTVKQSDMCLVCIAFASWVLKSSDPKAADAWKAALLANVSALSAIQYLRLYTKRKNPPLDDL